MKNLYRFFVVTLFCALSTFGPSVVQANSKDLALLFGKFVVDDLDGQYGTLILIDTDEDHYYFITNTHAVPPRTFVDQHIGVILNLKPKQKVMARLVANAPGYDLTLFAVPRLDVDGLDHRRVERVLNQAISKEEPSANQPVHIGLVGVAGLVEQGELAYTNLLWEDELDVLVHAAQSRETYFLLKNHPQQLSLNPLTISRTQQCPPAFVDQCLVVPIRSWGYSGGALLTSTKSEIDQQTTVAGIVAYFSPMAETTLVIPLSIVKKVTACLLGKEDCALDPRTYDDQGVYRYVARGCYQIRSGDFAGKVIRARSVAACRADSSFSKNYPFLPGGGNSMGGGGNSMGGGGNSMGGGGDPQKFARKGHFVLNDRYGNLTGAAYFEALAHQALRPLQWCMGDQLFCKILRHDPHIRGADLFMTDHSGFFLGDKEFADHDLSQFLSCYRQSQSRACLERPSDSLTNIPWNELRLSNAAKVGMAINRQIFKLASAEKIMHLATSGQAPALSELETAFISLKHLLRQRDPDQANFDVMTARGRPFYPFFPVVDATFFKIDQRQIGIRLKVGYPGEPIEETNAFVIEETIKRYNERRYTGYLLTEDQPKFPAMMTLHFDEEKEVYELRLFSVSEATKQQVFGSERSDVNVNMVRDGIADGKAIINIDALYLPLTTKHIDPSLIQRVASREERELFYSRLPPALDSPEEAPDNALDRVKALILRLAEMMFGAK